MSKSFSFMPGHRIGETAPLISIVLMQYGVFSAPVLFCVNTVVTCWSWPTTRLQECSFTNTLFMKEHPWSHSQTWTQSIPYNTSKANQYCATSELRFSLQKGNLVFVLPFHREQPVKRKPQWCKAGLDDKLNEFEFLILDLCPKIL